MHVQKCRKIRGLGCMNQACTRARVTQPSPHIFLPICIWLVLSSPNQHEAQFSLFDIPHCFLQKWVWQWQVPRPTFLRQAFGHLELDQRDAPTSMTLLQSRSSYVSHSFPLWGLWSNLWKPSFWRYNMYECLTKNSSTFWTRWRKLMLTTETKQNKSSEGLFNKIKMQSWISRN